VGAYAHDHFNDVVTNSFGVVAVVVAAHVKMLWVLDPICAIVIAFWIVYSWAQTGATVVVVCDCECDCDCDCEYDCECDCDCDYECECDCECDCEYDCECDCDCETKNKNKQNKQSIKQTALEQTDYLVGKTADPHLLQQLTHIAFNHSPKVTKIDTVRAYHFGNHFLVEVHVVVDEFMSMREAHDVGEALEVKLEEMNEVERAFVHLDYEWTHSPEHKKVTGLV